jgi:hypothetical protein
MDTCQDPERVYGLPLTTLARRLERMGFLERAVDNAISDDTCLGPPRAVKRPYRFPQ